MALPATVCLLVLDLAVVALLKLIHTPNQTWASAGVNRSGPPTDISHIPNNGEGVCALAPTLCAIPSKFHPLWRLFGALPSPFPPPSCKTGLRECEALFGEYGAELSGGLDLP